jgi:hypothetical protein
MPQKMCACLSLPAGAKGASGLLSIRPADGLTFSDASSHAFFSGKGIKRLSKPRG